MIALNAVAAETSSLAVQLGALTAISVLVVVGVYGLVAGIVKIDDLGLKLIELGGGQSRIGQFLVDAAPWIMKALGIIGTAAMFLVGGGIFSHNIDVANRFFADLAGAAGSLELVARYALDGLLGVIVGAIIVAVIAAAGWLRSIIFTAGTNDG